MELKIKDEYQNLIPSLSPEEYNALKESIRVHGLHNAIAVNAKGEILDGHNRYQICQELGIEPRLEVKAFDTPEEEAIFVLESNITRRQLSTVQRIKLVHEKLEPLERELAKRRQVAPLRTGGKAPLSLSSPDDNGPGGRTAEKMAEAAGTSPATYGRTVAVLQSAPETIKEKMMAGEITPTEAHREMKGGKTRKEDQAPPPRKFKIEKTRFDQAIRALREATESGKQSVDIWVQGKLVIGVGDEVEIST